MEIFQCGPKWLADRLTHIAIPWAKAQSWLKKKLLKTHSCVSTYERFSPPSFSFLLLQRNHSCYCWEYFHFFLRVKRFFLERHSLVRTANADLFMTLLEPSDTKLIPVLQGWQKRLARERPLGGCFAAASYWYPVAGRDLINFRIQTDLCVWISLEPRCHNLALLLLVLWSCPLLTCQLFTTEAPLETTVSYYFWIPSPLFMPRYSDRILRTGGWKKD